MPDRAGLPADRLDQVRMGMAERVDRHARREVEVTITVGRDEPRALAALEREIDARVGWQQMRCLDATHRRADNLRKRNVPPLRAARHGIVLQHGRLSTWPRTARRPPKTLTHCTSLQISVDALGRLGQNMWKQAARTLAPDSRHIVAFPSSNTTLRAADKS